MNLYMASNIETGEQLIIAIHDGGLVEARRALIHADIDIEKTPLTFLSNLDWKTTNVLIGKFNPINVTTSPCHTAR